VCGVSECISLSLSLFVSLGFRWLTLLLSQDFDLHPVIRLWDSLFSDADPSLYFINYLCAAMVVLIRDQLLVRGVCVVECLFAYSSSVFTLTNTQQHRVQAGEFTDCLSLLQRYPPTDVAVVVRRGILLKQLHSQGRTFTSTLRQRAPVARVVRGMQYPRK
jgi:hypothetical protein